MENVGMLRSFQGLYVGMCIGAVRRVRDEVGGRFKIRPRGDLSFFFYSRRAVVKAAGGRRKEGRGSAT